MTDLVDQLLAGPGLYVGKQSSHGDEQGEGVARVLITPLPGGAGVAMDYEVIVGQAGIVHDEHAMVTRTGGGTVLVTTHTHSPVTAIVAEAEPGWFPADAAAAPFPMGVRIEVPEPGHLIWSWSYASPGEELTVRDVGDVRHVP
jgi:hypothetical protein